MIKIGDRFGRWTVIGRGARPQTYVCRCDDGPEKEVFGGNLTRGKSLSCGCLRAEETSKRKTTHGGCRGGISKLYRVYHAMLERCYDPKNKQYKDYGGRGITVCDEWRAGFQPFSDWAEKNGYGGGLQIDRRDNEGPYSPDNCQFITQQRNNRKKRNTRYVTAFGETKDSRDWADDVRCAVSYDTLRARLLKGWSSEMAISTGCKMKVKYQ